MKRIGITGNIGAGKSAIRKVLQSYGYLVLDADELNAEILKEKNTIIKIVDTFGPSVVLPNATLSIDKKALSQIVFQDPQKLKLLESILHPQISELFQSYCDRLSLVCPNSWVFYEASLILEKGMAANFDALVCVNCSKEARFERVSSSRNMTRERFDLISLQQWNDEIKKRSCDFVIDNEENFALLPNKILQMLDFLFHKFS